jgi:DNA replication and repair protein RecF
MTLNRLVINNFRNITQADLALAAGFNFIVGPNGSGKTSLLEAIYTLGHGRAFRSLQTNRIIQYDANAFTLHGRLLAYQREYSLGLQKDRSGASLVRIDGIDGCRVSDLAQLLPMQLITPEGFSLLIGGPKFRRAYIDWGCFHRFPAFLAAWNGMRRLIKQRNAALRGARRYQEILPWDQSLVPLVEEVTRWRTQYCAEIVPEIRDTCEQFLPSYPLTFSLSCGWEKDANYATLLERNFERDRALTYTSVGPHKADFRIRMNGIPVEDSLSRGQLKLLMCALRLVQGENLTRQSGRSCVYLLDDFASELDETRRQLLATRLAATQAQVFVSAISAEQISDMKDQNSKMFSAKQGKIAVQTSD